LLFNLDMTSCISLGSVVFDDSFRFYLCGIVSSSIVKQDSKYSANASDFSELVSYLAIPFFSVGIRLRCFRIYFCCQPKTKVNWIYVFKVGAIGVIPYVVKFPLNSFIQLV